MTKLNIHDFEKLLLPLATAMDIKIQGRFNNTEVDTGHLIQPVVDSLKTKLIDPDEPKKQLDELNKKLGQLMKSEDCS